VNPALIAKQMYAKSEPEGAFSDAILRCLFYGLLIRRGNLLILAEPLYTDGTFIVAEKREPNCWWVHFVAAEKGSHSVLDLMEEVPYPLPWIGYKHKGKTKLFRWEQIRKDIYGRSPLSPSTSSA